jgi:hypothetical protein
MIEINREINLYILKANKVLFFMLLLCISGRIYAAGARFAAKYSSDSGIDRFINGNITNIETNRHYTLSNQRQNIIINTKIIYLHSGLFIVEDNWRKYIVYNEYFNENILTGFKLNAYTPIISINNGFEYNIKYETDTIIIEIWIHNEFRYKVEIRFDENSNRLIILNIERFDNGILAYNYSYYYEYVYNNFGRLEYVYRNYNDEKILIRSIYYDGIYRTMLRPFLDNLAIYSRKEIIIYDNDKIKYFIQTRLPEYDRAKRENLEEEEAEQFLLIIEYDNKGNEILQTLVREGSKYFEKSLSIYKLENIKFDQSNNWVNQNVYFSSGDGSYRLLETYTRKIIYE